MTLERVGAGESTTSPATLPERPQTERSFPQHRPVDHELRRAYETAKRLAEQLEVANLRELYRAAKAIRDQVHLELLELGEEVGQRP